MKNKIVIALGGNALGNNPIEQYEAVAFTAISIVDLVEKGNKVVIVHGNGPQVGMISLAFEKAKEIEKNVPSMPLSLSGSMSQGYIGLQLQQAIKNELTKRKIKRNVVTLITQTKVDINDPSFKKPTKPIGSFYSELEIKKIAKENNWQVGEDSGRGWRRMVPSPKPIDIYEKEIILELLEKDNIVIAGGGGGIPTIENKGVLQSIDAVIDKDLTAQKIAELVEADMFMILTAEDGIWKNFGKSDAIFLKEPSIKYLEELIDANEFPEGSMKPKVEAIINFINNSKINSKACITSLKLAGKALKNEAGSWVKK